MFWDTYKAMPSVKVNLHPKDKKVKFTLCLIKHHDMKTYRGVEVYIHIFLT
jgi:hypothetical protein